MNASGKSGTLPEDRWLIEGARLPAGGRGASAAEGEGQHARRLGTCRGEEGKMEVLQFFDLEPSESGRHCKVFLKAAVGRQCTDRIE
ncbi:hypothetical protein EVAR_59851_1 [Eumeta japonica]|uniref:Uncharacterized protein n=1 Tax=Eumeta variegata TaxID=151549 RepID=A0A4C1ZB20_EUMVA|nr:hypothetical protein EVAR_59851_1 [Eumeta japonica]